MRKWDLKDGSRLTSINTSSSLKRPTDERKTRPLQWMMWSKIKPWRDCPSAQVVPVYKPNIGREEIDERNMCRPIWLVYGDLKGGYVGRKKPLCRLSLTSYAIHFCGWSNNSLWTKVNDVACWKWQRHREAHDFASGQRRSFRSSEASLFSDNRNIDSWKIRSRRLKERGRWRHQGGQKRLLPVVPYQSLQVKHSGFLSFCFLIGHCVWHCRDWGTCRVTGVAWSDMRPSVSSGD